MPIERTTFAVCFQKTKGLSMWKDLHKTYVFPYKDSLFYMG